MIQVTPEEVNVGDTIVVKVGEKSTTWWKSY